MVAPEYVKESLKYWFKTGIKDSVYINSLVTAGKLTQEEVNEILTSIG